ncbi:hypothetical protein IPA_01040 [Ignicoccus pacificus DSM 13166]|uniref:Uncharacterized protein n=1 Tax=Ignicoccus pacificus DSM 13166 TaxID=940294 RepID=A0A977PKI0_9CREN|nr:hypothetical protein IPA_01040 [Ignicoccus pacificus DSM 13166]
MSILLEGLLKGALWFVAKKSLKRLYVRLLQRRAKSTQKLRIMVARFLDKLWFSLRRIVCDPHCWEVTEEELKWMIDKEVMRARIRRLKR